MGDRRRAWRLALGAVFLTVILALAGCGSAALPPPPPNTPIAQATVPGNTPTTTSAQPTAAATSGSAGGNTALIAAGKAAFNTSGCGACHMLSSAHATGVVGPSLNGIGKAHDAAWFEVQIANPCAPGHANAGGPKYNCSVMPPKAATGASAKAIASYLASEK